MTDEMLTVSGYADVNGIETLVTNAYTYDDYKLDTITYNGFDYAFEYDEFGNKTGTKIKNGENERTLSTNTYEPNNGRLKQTTYGNGDYTEPTYDGQDRIIQMTYTDVEGGSTTQQSYNWEYGNNGQLGRHKDNVNNMEWKYRYDIEGKVLDVDAERTGEGDLADDITYHYEYNNSNQLSSVLYNVSELRKYITYEYDWYNRYLSTNLSNGTKIGVDYDIFQRTSHAAVSRGSNTYKSEYVYEAGVENTMASRIEGINYTRNNESKGSLSYEYDNNGNITEIKEDGELQLSYRYDDQNQLIREDNKEIGQTIVYTYDAGGNIQNKKIYEYTTGEISGDPEDVIEYKYENNTWKDLMTSYDGKAITYDEIGNPLTYGDWELAWERGRQLSHLDTGEHDISYKYNEAGLRTEKTVDGVRTEYIWDGTQLLYENNGSRETMYYYDAAGQELWEQTAV